MIPTLEESLEQKTCVVGTGEQVAEAISWFDEQIGLENLLLFPAMPGDPYGEIEQQLHRIAEEVLPLLAYLIACLPDRRAVALVRRSGHHLRRARRILAMPSSSTGVVADTNVVRQRVWALNRSVRAVVRLPESRVRSLASRP